MTPAFLASVTSIREARLAAGCGADIIDCKDPARGALGALSVATVTAIRLLLGKDMTLSATIGDLESEPAAVSQAVIAMARSGCDLVKIGFFPGGEAAATIAALGRLDLGTVRLVGLLLADRAPDFNLIEAMARAGFVGVMLDTAGKTGGSLRAHIPEPGLARFVDEARTRGLFAGFAGSLAISDIAALLRLKPNVLGFRGALCADHVRTGMMCEDAVRAVRREIDLGGAHEQMIIGPASGSRAAE